MFIEKIRVVFLYQGHVVTVQVEADDKIVGSAAQFLTDAVVHYAAAQTVNVIDDADRCATECE